MLRDRALATLTAGPLRRASPLPEGRRGPSQTRAPLLVVWPPPEDEALSALGLSFLTCTMGMTVLSLPWGPSARSVGARRAEAVIRLSAGGAVGTTTPHPAGRLCRKPPMRMWLLSSSLPHNHPKAGASKLERGGGGCQFLGYLSYWLSHEVDFRPYCSHLQNDPAMASTPKQHGQ